MLLFFSVWSFLPWSWKGSRATFSFHNCCTSSCWTEERRRQCLVGGHFAIVIQDMFEGATKLRRLTWRYFRCMFFFHVLFLFYVVFWHIRFSCLGDRKIRLHITLAFKEFSSFLPFFSVRFFVIELAGFFINWDALFLGAQLNIFCQLSASSSLEQ